MDTASIAILAAILTMFAAFIAGVIWAELQSKIAQREAAAAKHERSAGLWNWLVEEFPGGELSSLSAFEVGRIANDLGVTTSELRELSRKGSDASSRLVRRLEALGLDSEKVARENPLEFRDMQRLCALCDRHGRCARDLSRDPGSDVWQLYCPNAGTIREVQASMALS
jgi:hypothetical protein